MESRRIAVEEKEKEKVETKMQGHRSLQYAQDDKFESNIPTSDSEVGGDFSLIRGNVEICVTRADLSQMSSNGSESSSDDEGLQLGVLGIAVSRLIHGSFRIWQIDPDREDLSTDTSKCVFRGTIDVRSGTVNSEVAQSVTVRLAISPRHGLPPV